MPWFAVAEGGGRENNSEALRILALPTDLLDPASNFAGAFAMLLEVLAVLAAEALELKIADASFRCGNVPREWMLALVLVGAYF